MITDSTYELPGIGEQAILTTPTHVEPPQFRRYPAHRARGLRRPALSLLPLPQARLSNLVEPFAPHRCPPFQIPRSGTNTSRIAVGVGPAKLLRHPVRAVFFRQLSDLPVSAHRIEPASSSLSAAFSRSKQDLSIRKARCCRNSAPSRAAVWPQPRQPHL
jgi:hypothetical protein